MTRPVANHYAVLGLHQRCTPEQIRDAFRILAKCHHPDVNPGSAEAVAQTQDLNAAYAVLSDPIQRQAYDESLAVAPERKRAPGTGKSAQKVNQDVALRLEEFFRGTRLEVRVNDPGNPDGPEVYPLEIPPATAPGARFRVRREGSASGGQVLVRVRAQPDFRFKIRGSDLRCDLRIQARRAAQGGTESLRGPLGDFLRLEIPPGVASGATLRLEGQGLPKPRGGRGDLLVRVQYRPDVQITRTRSR